jgi:tRNA 2-thiouridine synthesizing protein A
MSSADTAAEITVLDARGLICPMPVIRTQDQVKTLPSGALLDVVSTDRGALQDIPAWCRVHGHEVIEARQHDREIRIRLRVHRNG